MIPRGLRPGLTHDGWRDSGELSAPHEHTAQGEDPKVKCQFFLTQANAGFLPQLAAGCKCKAAR